MRRGFARSVARMAVAITASWALLDAASAQATVTVGSPLTAPDTGITFIEPTVANVALGEPGARTVSPVTGAIVSYRVNVAVVGQFAVRAIRPLGGNLYTGAGSSTPATPPGTGLQTFAANVPIQAGDLVGLDIGDSAAASGSGPSAPGSTSAEWFERLADGATAPPDLESPGFEILFNAEVAASNALTVGTTQRNKKKGTARLNLTLPNPGDLTAAGRGVRASFAQARTSNALAAGPAQLRIRATGKKRKKLNATGKVKVNVAITYRPQFGDPLTQSVKVKLRKKL
jgi:hypothetical protein